MLSTICVIPGIIHGFHAQIYGKLGLGCLYVAQAALLCHNLTQVSSTQNKHYMNLEESMQHNIGNE